MNTEDTGTIQTTCPYCGVGCGITAQQQETLSLKGDLSHPANFGKLCSKGSNLSPTLTLEGRLLHPQVHGIRASWDQAIQHVSREFKRIIDEHGPNSVAFYVSGQLLTEDYYVANKLMKGFIGSANIDTNSRLCMSSAVAAYKRAFGEDCVPGNYEDLELADLVILTGSNAVWCHPILFQRIKAAKAKNRNMKVVVIDPRETASCEIADLHLALKPGTDITLFNGLLSFLHQNNGIDQDYIEQHCQGFDNALHAANECSAGITDIAKHCQLEEQDVTRFYQWFCETPKTVTCFSQGINQSSQGSDKGNAIINCHLATGRIGKPGASPFSLTGQPNAMGGREVGGLANQLAAHKEFTEHDIRQVESFWQAPNMACNEGLKAVDMFQAIEHGQIKAIWIMGTNPVVSLPNADQVKRALQAAELVVVSDCIAKTDTSAYAHVLLPATGWGEKSGTVTNSERRISRQRNLIPPSGESLSDWRILTKFAHAMGWENQFPYETAADVFREHAALSQTNPDYKQFNLGALSTISDSDYDQLAPVQWPIMEASSSPRLYADGQFSTPNRKAQFIAVQDNGVANPTNSQWPLALNTGRIRDQWHTMTRTALAPPLSKHKPEPFVEINPQTAQQFQIEDKAYVTVSSQWGKVTVKAQLTEAIQPNQIFIPMHWNEQWARNGRVGSLVNPATDPVSGQPESKHTPCAATPWQPEWIGFLFCRDNMDLPNLDYASKIRGQHFYQMEFASDESPIEEWEPFVQNLAPQETPWMKLEKLQYQDKQQNAYRYAWIDQQGLYCCLYIGKPDSIAATQADRGWISSLFDKSEISGIERKALLSGRSPAGVEDCGPIVCSCFGVGANTLKKAIKQHNLTSAAEVGAQLKAGTNCGSCVAEINKLL